MTPAQHQVSGPAGLYVHIPFCQAKCAYCDFSSYAGLADLYDDYVTALGLEILGRAQLWQATSFDTVYIGGGTPTVLPSSAITELLDHCRRALPVAGDAEITLEANPGTVTLCALEDLHRAGVTRLSLGVQSFRDQELRLLGRIHDAQTAASAVSMARRSGFENLSLDLIYGLPNQTLSEWEASLRQAILLSPDHLSLYALSLGEGTPLAARVGSGALPTPDDDVAADMYELAEGMLSENGFVHYEISNWARRTCDATGRVDNCASRHNLHYWRNDPYLGLGASAHSYDGRCRSANTEHPRDYITRLFAGDTPRVWHEELDDEGRLAETMMLRMRLLEGMPRRVFRGRFGRDLQDVYSETVALLRDQGLLQVDQLGVRLTPRGRLLGNRVFAAFLP